MNPDHTDHLNTPRLVADATGTTVWRWDQQEPFGSNPADEDPDANSVAFDLPLRLPGQRYDKETGLHYNYFRDYEPGIGRYVESDPIGLQGGLNTYAYVGGDPLSAVDPAGLFCMTLSYPIDFSYEKTETLGRPGKWTMQTYNADGGEFPVPVWVVTCYCWRLASGTQETVLRIKWREKTICSCSNENRTKDYWDEPSRSKGPLSKPVDRKIFQWFTINENFAANDCRDKCNSLNAP